MRGAYKYPMLMTLSGSNLTAFNPPQSYMNQDFATLSGDWGIFNFARPSRLKKTTGYIAAGAAIVSTVAPNPITAGIAAGAGAASAGLSLVHNSYKAGPDPGTGFQPGMPVAPAPLPEKKSKAVPLIIGAVALVAALGIAA